MSVCIAPYSTEHCDAVGQLITSIQQGEFGIAITYADQPDLKKIESVYQRDNGNFWVALDSDTVVGTIALIDVGDSVGVLRKMFVHQDYRGMPYKVGQALLDTLITWANEKKFKKIFLGTIDKLAAAQKFYVKNNFNVIADEQLPASVATIRMKVDTKHYYRSLAA